MTLEGMKSGDIFQYIFKDTFSGTLLTNLNLVRSDLGLQLVTCTPVQTDRWMTCWCLNQLPTRFLVGGMSFCKTKNKILAKGGWASYRNQLVGVSSFEWQSSYWWYLNINTWCTWTTMSIWVGCKEEHPAL